MKYIRAQLDSLIHRHQHHPGHLLGFRQLKSNFALIQFLESVGVLCPANHSAGTKNRGRRRMSTVMIAMNSTRKCKVTQIVSAQCTVVLGCYLVLGPLHLLRGVYWDGGNFITENCYMLATTRGSFCANSRSWWMPLKRVVMRQSQIELIF